MNPAQLFDQFDRISDALDAVPRLRRFVLDLAVRGKLVEQDPNDESASDLLKRIQAEKERLVEAGKIRQHDRLPRIDQDDAPCSIPSGWRWERFIEVAAIQSNLVNPKDYPDLPHIAPDNIESGTGRLLPYETIGASAVFSSKHLFHSGCILYSKIRPALAKAVIVDFDGLCSADMYPILPLVNREYLHKYMLSGMFVRQSVSEDNRVAMPKINQASLSRILVAVPPLAEQQRVAAKVDELMALCDRLEAAQAEREHRRDRLAAASLQRLNRPDADPHAFRDHARFHLEHLARLTRRPDQIAQLRQTILNLAVRGQLVPQDPTDEPASELLKRIHSERVRLGNQRGESLQPPLPITDEKIPAALPDSWDWVRVGALLLDDSQNGYSKKPDDAPDGVPILRISAGTLRKDGIVAEEEHKLIGGVSAMLREQYQLQPGDLLACRFNGNRSFVGRLSLYLGYLGIKPIYPDKLIRLRLLSELVLPKLVRCFSESSLIRNDVESYSATTVGNWGISASNLKKVMIPLPPLSEQHRIVAKVDELMALCDRLDAQLTIAATESRNLLEAVLHDALASAS